MSYCLSVQFIYQKRKMVTQGQDLICFSQCPTNKCTRSWEGIQPEQMNKTNQRDILYHMTSCSEMKAVENSEERGLSVL